MGMKIKIVKDGKVLKETENNMKGIKGAIYLINDMLMNCNTDIRIIVRD